MREFANAVIAADHKRMSTPHERLNALKERAQRIIGYDENFKSVEAEITIDCAIELSESVLALTAAANDMANRTVTVINNLKDKIDAATKQAEESARESGKMAAESANLTRKLNRLTIWIIIAAFLSAGAACVQAWTAWYTVQHPQQHVVLVSRHATPVLSASRDDGMLSAQEAAKY